MGIIIYRRVIDKSTTTKIQLFKCGSHKNLFDSVYFS